MVTMKDVNIADFGIEAITDNGRVQLSENKKGPLSVDTYNKMIDPNDKEFAMADTDNAPEEDEKEQEWEDPRADPANYDRRGHFRPRRTGKELSRKEA